MSVEGVGTWWWGAEERVPGGEFVNEGWRGHVGRKAGLRCTFNTNINIFDFRALAFSARKRACSLDLLGGRRSCRASVSVRALHTRRQILDLDL